MLISNFNCVFSFFFECRLPRHVCPVSQLALTLFLDSFISFQPITSPFSDCKMQVNRLQPILHWLTFVPNLGKSNHYNCKPLFREPLIHWNYFCVVYYLSNAFLFQLTNCSDSMKIADNITRRNYIAVTLKWRWRKYMEHLWSCHC